MNMIYIYISKAAHLHSVCCNREDQKTSSFVGHIFGMPVWYKTIKHGIIWVCMARFWPSWYRSPKSTYIYIYIFEYVKKTRGICTVLSRVLARVFPIYQLFLWCISLTLDTLRNRPFPVRLGHMAISEDPNLEESIHFFRPQPDDLYIYNRYLCHCVICISTTCFVKSGGPIPQTNTYPSEDHGI